MTLTLWDIMIPLKRPRKPAVRPAPPARPAPRQSAARDRYLTMQREMLARYGVRVRKWRTHSSGVAWQVTYADGSVARLIESPRPRGPISAAIFLHEIGHHAIGFGVYKPRCVEEHQAWCFALEQMDAWDIAITDRVRKRVHESLAYAVAKAQRRGLKRLPTVMEPYAGRGGCGWVDPRAKVARGPS